MSRKEKEHLLLRAADERMAARAATSRESAAIHRELAARYLEKAMMQGGGDTFINRADQDSPEPPVDADNSRRSPRSAQA